MVRGDRLLAAAVVARSSDRHEGARALGRPRFVQVRDDHHRDDARRHRWSGRLGVPPTARGPQRGGSSSRGTWFVLIVLLLGSSPTRTTSTSPGSGGTGSHRHRRRAHGPGLGSIHRPRHLPRRVRRARPAVTEPDPERDRLAVRVAGPRHAAHRSDLLHLLRAAAGRDRAARRSRLGSSRSASTTAPI